MIVGVDDESGSIRREDRVDASGVDTMGQFVAVMVVVESVNMSLKMYCQMFTSDVAYARALKRVAAASRPCFLRYNER